MCEALFLDSHAHIDAPQFDEDRDEMLARAAHAGVGTILSIGCLGPRPGILQDLLALTEKRDEVLVAAGVHPHDARHWSEEVEDELRQALNHPRVVALGEIGLDYYYENSSRSEQRRVFVRQLELAAEVRKPIIIHTRDAWEETLDTISGFYSESDTDSGIFHCFGEGAAQAEQCLSKGFLVGLGGIVTFKKSEALREVVGQLPPVVLLLETDAPYLAPVPHRGKRNEPAFLPRVAEVLASCRGVSVNEIGRLTTANFRRLMRLQGLKG